MKNLITILEMYLTSTTKVVLFFVVFALSYLCYRTIIKLEDEKRALLEEKVIWTRNNQQKDSVNNVLNLLITSIQTKQNILDSLNKLHK